MTVARLAPAFFACLLIGCAATPSGPVGGSPRRVAFDPSLYTRYSRDASGSVEGQAFIKTAFDGTVHVPAGEPIYLKPANAYTQEWIDRAIRGRERLQPEDPRATQFAYEARGDSAGNFVFPSVAPGDYVVVASVHWVRYPNAFLPSTQFATLAEPITVRAGATARVLLTRPSGEPDPAPRSSPAAQ